MLYIFYLIYFHLKNKKINQIKKFHFNLEKESDQKTNIGEGEGECERAAKSSGGQPKWTTGETSGRRKEWAAEMNDRRKQTAGGN